MNLRDGKTSNKNQSVADHLTRRRGSSEKTAQLTGGHTGKAQQMANNSAQVRQMKMIQAMADNFVLRGSFQNTGPESIRGNHSADVGKPVVQRVIKYKGVQYDSIEKLWKAEGASDIAFQNKLMGKAYKCISDKDVVYDLENNLEPTKDKVVKSQAQLDLELGEEATSELELEKNTKAYSEHNTYSVAIDEGAAFMPGGPVEFVGTHGLRGCVAVMIECENKGNQAYFVAHVSSEKAGDENLILKEISKILNTLKEVVGEEIEWSNFDNDEESKNRLLLVRSPEEDQKLFINMRTILAKSGAKLFATEHTNVTLDFREKKGRFIGNEQPDEETEEPELSRNNLTPKDSGYGMSHQDMDYLDQLYEADDETSRETAEKFIHKRMKQDELKELDPEELKQEMLYQQYARELGDI